MIGRDRADSPGRREQRSDRWGALPATGRATPGSTTRSATTRSVGALVVLVGALVALVGAAMVPAVASSDDALACGARVVDLPGVLDVDAVAGAASVATAGDVRVLAFDDLAGRDLAAAIDEYLVTCHAETGTIAPDLIVLSFSTVDRQSDVFFGSDLPGGRIVEEVRAEMTEPFPDGRFTDGVLDAIALIESRVGEAGDEAGDGDGDGGSGGGDDGGGAAGVGVGGVPLAVPIGAAAALAGGGGLAASAVHRRRRLVAARNRLADAVTQPRIRVGAAREQSIRLGSQAELWAHLASGSAAAVLDEKRRRVGDANAAMERVAALLGETTPEGIEGASAEEVRLAMRRVEELNEALDRNERALAELLAVGARLDHLRVALPAKKELLNHELTDAYSLAASRRSEGWNVDAPVEELAQIRRHLDGADVAGLPLDLLTLSDGLEGAEAHLFAAVHNLQSLPDRAAAVVTWRELQGEAVVLEQRRASEARTSMNVLAGVHDPASWAWAAQHPARAEDHLARSVELAAASVARADEQDFDAAGAALEEAGLELIAADELLDQVDDLVVDLTQARSAAPVMVAESRHISERVAAYVAAHRPDLAAELAERPQQVSAAIDGLEAMLDRSRPNFLLVAQTADRLNRELDEVQAGARQQHQRMEALRRQADREVARASRAVLRARESIGWELFGSRESAALDRLDHALRALPGEPMARIDGARSLADEAVSIQERIIARRRRGNTWVVGVGGGVGNVASGRRPSGVSTGGGGGGRSFGGGGGGHSFGGGRSTGSW